MANVNNVIKYYDECMQEYDIVWTGKKDLAIHYGFWDSGTRSHTDALINMNRMLTDRVRIKSTDIVLDAGCGIGGSSIWIAKNTGAKVIGITLSKKQADKAKKFAGEHGVEHLVKFYERDYLKTGFKSGFFDVVWGLESVNYAEDKKDFVKEAYRILKPGGRLVVADGFRTKAKYSQGENGAMRKWLDGWAVPDLAEINEFKKLLVSARFKNIEFSDIKSNIMPSSIKIYRLSILGIGIWKFLATLGLRSKTQVGHVLAGIYQHRTLRRGLWTYAVFYSEK